ncbi:Amino acid permease [Paraburkholderia kururiensis]|uniref:APC family permease n=1 Tax=Paraburkholderia kururiensis TaxID=984307 RepID=UPI0039A481E9
MSDFAEKSRDRLHGRCLSFPETLAQSVANISPSVTPLIIVPLVFASAGQGTWLSYVIATVGIVLVGLNVNQFAKRTSSPGSLYAFAGRGLGSVAGFLTGWCLLAAYLLTATAVMSGALSYASMLMNVAGIRLPAGVIGLFFSIMAWYVAWKDVKISARLMLAIEGFSVLSITAVAIIVLRHEGLLDYLQLDLASFNARGVRDGLMLAIFGYVGFESAASLGEEARSPLRNIPRAIALGILLSGLFFVTTAYVEVAGFNASGARLANFNYPYNYLSERVNFAWLGTLISIGVTVSLFACTVASINAAARVLLAMGRHGILPSAFKLVHISNRTPHVAATMAAATMLASLLLMLGLGNSPSDIFDQFGTVATYGFLVSYILVSLAAPVYLRHRGELRARDVFVSLAAIAFILPAAISTVYPTPAAPADRFPWYFAAYVLVGLAWFLVVNRRSDESLFSKIKTELDGVLPTPADAD